MHIILLKENRGAYGVYSYIHRDSYKYILKSITVSQTVITAYVVT